MAGDRWVSPTRQSDPAATIGASQPVPDRTWIGPRSPRFGGRRRGPENFPILAVGDAARQGQDARSRQGSAGRWNEGGAPATLAVVAPLAVRMALHDPGRASLP